MTCLKFAYSKREGVTSSNRLLLCSVYLQHNCSSIYALSANSCCPGNKVRSYNWRGCLGFEIWVAPCLLYCPVICKVPAQSHIGCLQFQGSFADACTIKQIICNIICHSLTYDNGAVIRLILCSRTDSRDGSLIVSNNSSHFSFSCSNSCINSHRSLYCCTSCIIPY